MAPQSTLQALTLKIKSRRIGLKCGHAALAHNCMHIHIVNGARKIFWHHDLSGQQARRLHAAPRIS